MLQGNWLKSLLSLSPYPYLIIYHIPLFHRSSSLSSYFFPPPVLLTCCGLYLTKRVLHRSVWNIHAAELRFHNHGSSQRINIKHAANIFLSWLTQTLGPPSDFTRLLSRKDTLNLSYNGQASLLIQLSPVQRILPYSTLLTLSQRLLHYIWTAYLVEL